MTVTEPESPPDPARGSSPAPPSPAAPEALPRRFSPDAVEFLVVMAFSYVPGLIYSMIALGSKNDYAGVSPILYLQYLPRMAQLAIPVIFIAHLRGRPLRTLGLTTVRWTDVPLGIVALIGGWIGAVICVYMLYLPLQAVDPAAVQNAAELFPQAKAWWGYVAIAAASTAVGFGEEVFFRGYLISLWERLSGSKAQSVIVTSLLFGIVHVYQGVYGVASATGIGLVYGLMFVRLRRLWPLAFAHALTDFISLAAR
jgi:membrane protease YdiL (CAAX protease family)